MSYTPNQISETSAIGVNSDTAIAGGNWSGNTYTGAGELNDYAYVGVNLQVDEAGTLKFQFSQDGSNWSTYPVAGFDIASGINEVHTAWKGGRYFRVVFEGTGGRSFFRLKTFYSHHPLPLSASINQSIGSDQDATVVRAIIEGKNPNDTYTQGPISGVDDGNSTTDTLGVSAVFTGTWKNIEGYHGITVLCDGTSGGIADGTLEMQFSHDGVTVNRNINISVDDIASVAPRTLGAVAKYFRIVYTNGTTAHTSTDIQTMLHTQQVQLVSRANQTLAVDADVSNVRSISTGENPSGTFVNSKSDGIAFTTQANLTSGSFYLSPVLDARGFTQLQTHVFADQDGTMEFIFYTDAGGSDEVRRLTIPYDSVNGFELFSAPCFTDFVQYKFTNNGPDQGDFHYETKFLTKALSGQVLALKAPIVGGMVANVGRSVIVGEDPAGSYRNVPTDTEGHLKVNINDPLTAFGDLRTAELTPQVHLTFPYNINTDMIDITTGNGGTVTQSGSMAILNTSTSTSGDATLASRNVVNYRSGLGGLTRFTAMFTSGVANSNQIVGIGDNEDGFFIGYSGDTFGTLVRKDGVDDWTPQTGWNIDVMDGNDGESNPSNMLLDKTKLNVYEISYQWLGAGEIKYYIENPDTGGFVPVHRIKYANANTTPSILNPSLTLSANVSNDGNNTDIEVRSASMAGFTEGKNVLTGPINAFGDNSTHNAETEFFHLRNKATYQGRTNKVRLILKSLSCGNDTNGLANFNVYLNAGLGATAHSWTDIDADNSVVEVDTAKEFSTAGKLLFKGVVGKDSGETFNLEDLNIVVAPGDIITITSDSAGASNVQSATLLWQEDF